MHANQFAYITIFVLNPLLIYLGCSVSFFYQLNFVYPKIHYNLNDLFTHQQFVKLSTTAYLRITQLFLYFTVIILISTASRHTASSYLICSPSNILWSGCGAVAVSWFISYNRQILSMEQILGVNCLIVSLFILTLSANLLYFFLLLEASVYTFFFILAGQGVHSGCSRSALSTSLLYNFTLNFFSSIAIFSTLITVYFYEGVLGIGPYLTFYKGWSSLLLLSALFIKISAGPWVFISVEVYKGMPTNILLLYIVVFMIFLVPKIIDIVLDLTIANPAQLVLAGCTLLTVGAGFLFNKLRAVTTIKVFLTYSSTITSLYILVLVFVNIY